MAHFSIISVFTDDALGLKGNTSAVVYTDKAIGQKKMQEIASNFNQPATTFLSPKENNSFSVSWFAPDAEIGLCGHGSAAAAAYLKQEHHLAEATLHYKGGRINVSATANYKVSILLNPIEVIDQTQAPAGLEEALGIKILGYFTTANKDIVLVESENELAQMKPNFSALAKLKPFGYAVTAPSTQVDFVSRTLVPKVQQLEDHATGSTHAVLAPFWAERLNKKVLKAIQLSLRGGAFDCEMTLGKVKLGGNFLAVASGQVLL